jgi:hypothetical protein
MTKQDASKAESLTMLALLIPGMIWSAWVTVQLWGWFIVPFGLPELTIAWAVGIGCLVSKFVLKPIDIATQVTLKMYITSLINTGWFLLFGYVAQSFM